MTRQTIELENRDKPQFKRWQALYLSFFSAKLYVDVVKRWQGLGLRYFLLLMLVASLPFALGMIHDFGDFFTRQVRDPVQKIPPLPIQNAQVTFDKPMPYLIKNNSGQVVAIIDTTGTIKTKTSEYPELVALVTATDFIYWPPPLAYWPGSMKRFFNMSEDKTAAQSVYHFSEESSKVFDASKWVKMVQYTAQLTMYPMVVFPFFFIFLVFLLAFTMMAQLLAKLFFKFTFSYPQACRLLIVASTPSVFIFMFSPMLNQLFTERGILLVGVLAVYFSYGTVAVKRENTDLVSL